jgi:Inner membrane protein YgaP-like, transmembrane domain
MTPNMGSLDRGVRVLIAIGIGYLYFTGRIGGILGIVLCVLAAVFLLTSFVAWCPAYLPFGLSTRRKASGPPKS